MYYCRSLYQYEAKLSGPRFDISNTRKQASKTQREGHFEEMPDPAHPGINMHATPNPCQFLLCPLRQPGMARGPGPSRIIKPTPKGQWKDLTKSKATGPHSPTKGRKRGADPTDSGSGQSEAERDEESHRRTQKRPKTRNIASTEEVVGTSRSKGKGKQPVVAEEVEDEVGDEIEPDVIEDDEDDEPVEVSLVYLPARERDL
jgi:hypothetical protein